MVANNPDTEQAGEVIQSMAAEAGFDIKIRLVEFATSFKQVQAGEFQVFQINWSGRIDPDGNSYVFLHTGAPQNDGGYSNPEADKLMEQCISEVRTLSYLLHPPTMDAAGFVSAARWYVEGYGQRSGLNVTLDAPADLDRLPDAVELALFRVLQEALTNVHRHSGAAAAEIVVRQDAEQVVLEIKDNGRGIPAELLNHFHATGSGTGVGIAGIRERIRELGGKLTLESDSGGTLVRVAIPLAAAVPHEQQV